MIVRIWHASASPQLAHLYTTHFNDAVLPRLRMLPGFRGAYLLHRSSNGEVEFVVQTLWDSMEAVKRFAGPEPGVAVVDEDARAVLTSFDTEVQHFDVIASP